MVLKTRGGLVDNYPKGFRVDFKGREHLVLGSNAGRVALINSDGRIFHESAGNVKRKKQTCFFKAVNRCQVYTTWNHHNVHEAGQPGRIIGTVEGEFVLDIAEKLAIVSPENVKYVATDRAGEDLRKSRWIDSNRCGITCYTEKCEVCGEMGQFLHHRSNVRHGYEKSSDYSILCGPHHLMVHRITVGGIHCVCYDPERMYARMAADTLENLNRIWHCPYGFNALAMPDLGVQVALAYKLAAELKNDYYQFPLWDDRLHEFARKNLDRVDDAYFI